MTYLKQNWPKWLMIPLAAVLIVYSVIYWLAMDRRSKHEFENKYWYNV